MALLWQSVQSVQHSGPIFSCQPLWRCTATRETERTQGLRAGAALSARSLSLAQHLLANQQMVHTMRSALPPHPERAWGQQGRGSLRKGQEERCQCVA